MRRFVASLFLRRAVIFTRQYASVRYTLAFAMPRHAEGETV